MDGLDVLVLDPASVHIVRAAASWPIPPEAVGPVLFTAILLLVLILFGDMLAPLKGPRR